MLAHRLAAAVLAGALLAPLTVPARAQAGKCDLETDGAHCDDGNRFNGYWWPDGWVPGFVSLRTWFTPAPTHSVGAVVFYAPNVMEAQARYRGVNMEGFLDGIAMMSPADIGRTVWLKRPGHDWEGPYVVLDCAQRDDFYPIIMHRGEVAEVGFATAVRWGMVRYTSSGWKTVDWSLQGVEVWKGDAPPRAESKAVPVDHWLMSHLEFTSALAVSFGEWTPVYKRNPVRWLWADRKTWLYPTSDWLGFLWGEEDLWGEESLDYCRGFRRAVLDECQARD
jgi:hypothetical protein